MQESNRTLLNLFNICMDCIKKIYGNFTIIPDLDKNIITHISKK